MTAIAANLATAPAPAAVQLGRSQDGRPIVAFRVGDPTGPRIVVVGCIHGNECAGIPVAEALERTHPHADLWIVPDLNPDGHARGTRQNARGVDLNRNWPTSGWAAGSPASITYGGPRPRSEPETRAIRALILRERPAVTIWYHQPFGLVDRPEAGDDAITRAYASRSGLPARQLAPRPGSMSRWQNARVRAGSSIVVELPGGPLSAAAARRNADAVLELALPAATP